MNCDALACFLIAQGILFSPPYGPIRRSFGESPVRSVSCAIIVGIHEKSGLAGCFRGSQ